jgi:hypothetical protein
MLRDLLLQLLHLHDGVGLWIYGINVNIRQEFPVHLVRLEHSYLDEQTARVRETARDCISLALDVHCVAAHHELYVFMIVEHIHLSEREKVRIVKTKFHRSRGG